MEIYYTSIAKYIPIFGWLIFIIYSLGTSNREATALLRSSARDLLLDVGHGRSKHNEKRARTWGTGPMARPRPAAAGRPFTR